MDKGVCHDDDDNDDEIKGVMIDARDLSDHEQLVMKGDLVGNTAYSAKWILKTLLTLSKVDEEGDCGWSEDLETDLCFLWDMTTEKDIIYFLVENNFLSVAQYLLTVSKHDRMKEIIVGIIGNMCSQAHILLQIAEMNELIDVILILLTSEDTETLIQIFRILQAAMWDIQQNNSSKWRDIFVECKFLGQSITFILENSTNECLLTSAFTLLQSVIMELNDNSCLLRDLFETTSLILALKSSFNQLIPPKEEDYTEKERDYINNWLEISLNLLQKQHDDLHIESYLDILNIFIMILHRENINLIPLEETKALCIYKCIENIHWFQLKNYKVNMKDLHITVVIMEQLHSEFMAGCQDETVTELLKYIERYWLKLIEQYNICEMNELFTCFQSKIKDYLINFIIDNSSVDTKCNLAETLKINK